MIHKDSLSACKFQLTDKIKWPGSQTRDSHKSIEAMPRIIRRIASLHLNVMNKLL